LYGFVVDAEHSFCHFNTGKYAERKLSYVGVAQESFHNGIVIRLKELLDSVGVDKGENADFGATANRVNYDAIFIVA
jgi:hypothetical protein